MCRLGWMLTLVGLISGGLMLLDVVSLAGTAPVRADAASGPSGAVWTAVWGNTRVWAAAPDEAGSAAPAAHPAAGRPVQAWWSLYSGLLILMVAFGMRGLLRRR